MRIVTAMSGGVDSSVAAALLQQQGYEVIGISMQIWADYCTPGKRSCCSPTHLDDARTVAEQLGIPYYAINFQKELEDKVINPFCQEYLSGRTPNPCIPCNHELKFKALWWKAKSLGADYVASGHYARIVSDSQGKFCLKRGLDKAKDQSYFLFSLTQEMLAHTLFPLGEYEKPRVRELARSFGLLPVADKSESQEICFIPAGGYREFLKKRCPGQLLKGDILNKGGQKLREHQGIALYTIGQRRGLGLSARQPLYVIKIDAQNNTLTVGEEADLYQPCLLAKGGNLDSFTHPLKVRAQIRYRHQAAEATLYPLENDQVLVEFAQPQRAITPGQAVVFYREDTVVGGAWIEQGGEKEELLCKKN